MTVQVLTLSLAASHQQVAVVDRQALQDPQVLTVVRVAVQTEPPSTQELQDKAITAELETAAAQLQQLRVAAVEQVQSAETQRPQQVQTADQDQHHQSLEHP